MWRPCLIVHLTKIQKNLPPSANGSLNHHTGSTDISTPRAQYKQEIPKNTWEEEFSIESRQELNRIHQRSFGRRSPRKLKRTRDRDAFSGAHATRSVSRRTLHHHTEDAENTLSKN